jgi:hypothetical protein
MNKEFSMYSSKERGTKLIVLALLTAAPMLLKAAPRVPSDQITMSVPVMVVPLQDIQGVVSWETLAKVKQVATKTKITPEFTKEITALNDKEIKLQGFMMPLDPGQKQTHFLISVNPSTCSYCLPAGPEGVVEVKSKTPIKYSFEPIIVSGKMAVLKDDPMGLFYRLTDAMPASAK